MIKVIFMGTPEFSVAPLEALIAAPDISVEAVVCSPDKPVGRKQVLTPPPTKVCALAHGLPVLQPETLKHQALLEEQLKSYDADFFVVVAYGYIIPKAILGIPHRMPINIHGSLLPAYRGASPIQAALLAGETHTGLTFIEMVSKMDAGPMLAKVEIPIAADETSDSLFEKLSVLAAQHICDVLRNVMNGTIVSTEQLEAEATYCGKLTRDMGCVGVHQESAEQIYRRWQAFTSWPGIYTMWQGKRLKLLRCSYAPTSDLTPGTVISQGNELWIGTVRGHLQIDSLQLEGKQAMSVPQFLQSNPSLLDTGL